jgi:hypothetical protein
MVIVGVAFDVSDGFDVFLGIGGLVDVTSRDLRLGLA